MILLTGCGVANDDNRSPCQKADELVFSYADEYCIARDCCQCECFSRKRWAYGDTYPCECGSAIISVFGEACHDPIDAERCLDNPEFCVEEKLDQIIVGCP